MQIRQLMCQLLVGALFCIAAAAGAETAPQVVERALLPVWWVEGEQPEPQTLRERMAHHGTPAISLAVITDGALAWSRAWGFANAASRRRATTRTRFQAASISKPISALAALVLSEAELLDIDADVNGYLERWQLPDSAFTRSTSVTVRRILNHTAGLNVPGFTGYDPADQMPDAVAVLNGEGNTEPLRVVREPGTAWQYSGGGYTLLQVLLEDVIGQDFPILMKTRILDPLQMRHSTFAQPLPHSMRAGAAVGYRVTGVPVAGGAHSYPELAAAGLWSTPTDLARYLLAVRRMARGESGLLSRSTVREMLAVGMNNHGLGPDVRQLQDGLRFGHDGGNEGFQSTMFLSLDLGYGAVVMTNSDGGFGLIGEVLHALGRHYGWPGFEPEIKRVITLKPEALKRYTGTYQLGELGRLFVAADASGLTVTADFHDNVGRYRPEAEHVFFDTADRGSLVFEMRDGQAVALTAGQQFRAVRVSAAAAPDPPGSGRPSDR